MSTISNLIFNGAKHKVTSSYGPRTPIKTSSGTTASFHNGTDYGTDGKKIAQYAIEDGYIFAAQRASDGALYVWVIYPRIEKAFLHYHLDSYKVKAGQPVKKGTLLGYTGKTGKATGIHLHLGVRELKNLSDSRIKSMTWDALRTCNYIDPEKVSYSAPTASKPSTAKPVTYSKGIYKVVTTLLNVRAGAGTIYKVKTFKELTANAQTQIKALNNNKPANGLVNGCTCTVSQVNGHWGKIPSGWICLDYCKRV